MEENTTPVVETPVAVAPTTKEGRVEAAMKLIADETPPPPKKSPAEKIEEGQDGTEEEKPEEKKPEEKKPEESVSKKLKMLIDEEARVQKARRALNEEQAKWRKEMEETKELKELMALANSNPGEFARRTKLDINKMTADILDGKVALQVSPEVAEMQAKLAAMEKAAEEAKHREMETVRTRQLTEISTAASNADKYPALAGLSAHPTFKAWIAEAAMELHYENWKETKQIAPFDQILAEVESRMVPHAKEMARQLSRLLQEDKKQPSAPTKQPPKTISQNATSRTATDKPRPKTREERFAEAMRIMEEEKKA